MIFVQIILASLLIVAILLQGKEGGFLKNRWEESFRSRRGMEKLLFFLTIILAILFLASSVVNFIQG